MKTRVLLALPALLAAVTLWAASPTEKEAGAVSFLRGDALRAKSENGPWTKLQKSHKVYEGEWIKTEKATRLEIRLKDGSAFRVAAESQVHLAQASFPDKGDKREFSATVALGRVWSNVTRAAASEAKFEVRSANAVAGVRGTKFDVAVGKDKGTKVKVYDGKVLVSNKPMYQVEGATKDTRKQVAGPGEITKQAWSELVASAMQAISVGPDGKLSSAEPIDPKEQDEWASWNKNRDEGKDE